MPEIEKLILKIDVQMSEIKGKISQVIGPVVDVSFEKGTELPKIYDAFYVNKADGTKVVLEVQSHVGENSVRAISMDSTDGFTRGMEVIATGGAIKMPTGDEIKGRLFNVVGEAIDGINTLSNENGLPIHREGHYSRTYQQQPRFCLQELRL